MSTPEPTLVDFLLDRIAWEEKAAQQVTAAGCSITSRSYTPLLGRQPRISTGPARVRLECTARRRIVAMWQEAHANREGTSDTEGLLEDVLRVLAVVYSDHPSYREEWRP
jgi:hypothetical protein